MRTRVTAWSRGRLLFAEIFGPDEATEIRLPPDLSDGDVVNVHMVHLYDEIPCVSKLLKGLKDLKEESPDASGPTIHHLRVRMDDDAP